MEAVKVIATTHKQRRVVIDNVDSITAAMTVDVLNQVAAKMAKANRTRPPYYHYEQDDYAVPMGAET